MIFRRQFALTFLLVMLLCFWTSLPSNLEFASSWKCNETTQLYGYAVGDSFHFTDSITETLETHESHLYEETTSTFKLVIQAIDENTINYTIRITAQITNLTAGLWDLNYTIYLEGFTPIFAGPRAYFTHTNWEAHRDDFQAQVEIFLSQPHVSGYTHRDIDQRFFHWNFTQYVSGFISQFDIDQDGETDAYDSINMYTVQFDERGVLLFREFYDEMRFEGGSRYLRIRQISLQNYPPLPFLLLPQTLIIIGLFIGLVGLLSVLTIVFYRRYNIPHSTPTD